MRHIPWFIFAISAASACAQDRQADPYDLDFEIPRSHSFAESLSEYRLYAEPVSELQPAERAILYELSSELFTDYAYKHRLVRVPEGSSVRLAADGRLEYPEGALLAKTFYYPDDMRDPEGSRRVIETRLLVKTDGVWNVATYLWNEEQSDATVLLDGTTTDVSWIDASGEPRSTEYAVPHEGECVTCHQLDGASAYIGPTLANLNAPVTRDGDTLHQLDHLQMSGVFGEVDRAASPVTPDYRDRDLSLAERARAYLDLNCSHCHRPGAWDESTRRDFDFRYAIPLASTGLTSETERVIDALDSGKMPFLGTTMRHDDGLRLVLDYLNSL